MHAFRLECYGITAALIGFLASTGHGENFLEGRVTDEKNRPIEGATVHIADCIGTCLGGAARITDADGRYVFEHKTFRNVPSLSVSMPGRYHKSTDWKGPKLQEAVTDVPRHADFVLDTPAAATITVKGKVPDGWTQQVLLRAGRDAKLHRYDQTGNYVQGWDRWSFDIIPRSESYHVVVVQHPAVEPSEDRKVQRERERESRRQSIEFVSQPIRFVDPQRYDLQLELTESANSKTTHLGVISLKDATYQDRTAELVASDPLFGAPVNEETRKRAIKLLERVAEAATPWNARPPKSIAYQYDVVNSKKETTHVTIDRDSPSGPSWSDISRQRGFAWMPPLRWLFSQPENVVFYRVDISDDRAELAYRLKSHRGFAAGLGVGPSWNGFFTRSFSTGSITIDPISATVLEHRFSSGPVGQQSIETFGDYVSVETGYAPKTLRIQTEGFDFRLRFLIHNDQLWLLDEATHGDAEQPSMRIENVVVKTSAP